MLVSQNETHARHPTQRYFNSLGPSQYSVEDGVGLCFSFSLARFQIISALAIRLFGYFLVAFGMSLSQVVSFGRKLNPP